MAARVRVETGGDRGDRLDIVEQGDVFFLYRPRVETHAPKGLRDVQRFYVVLKPAGRALYRMVVIGRKRLPDIARHERDWGFVEAVGRHPGELAEALREQHYRTRTRGERTLPAARPAGEGVYALVQGRNALHLVYALELPERPGPVQTALKIQPEGSFAVAVANPEMPAPPQIGERRARPALPKALQAVFRDRRFAHEDIALLDRVGVELVLIGASRRPRRALGIALDTEHEDLDSAEIVHRLKVAPRAHPVEPLLTGQWA